jgi:zinc protease
MRTNLALLAAATAIALAANGAPVLAAQGAGAAAPRLSVPPLAYKTRKLRNGLTVYMLRDTTTPNVSVSLWYEVGAKHDPAGRSGFAHLFEHILSRKTVNMPYNMINKLTEDVGGIRNASTSWDRTNYYETVPARYLETMLWTHAERMARPVVDAEVFENERNVVKEELRQRVLAPPYGRLGAFVLTENAWDRTPHRRPTIGSIADLEAAKLEDARAFHEAFYGPDTATLIVAGNFDEAQLSRWVDSYFGAIPARPRKTSLAITERDAPRTRERLVTAYALTCRCPWRHRSGRRPGQSHPTCPSLQRTQRDPEPGATIAACIRRWCRRAWHQRIRQLVDTEESGFYAPFVILAGGKSLPDAEAALAAEIERLRSAPGHARGAGRSQERADRRRARQRETFQGRAFASAKLWSAPAIRARRQEIAAIQRVSVADVQRVARRYLQPNSRVAIRYVNEKERPAGQTGDSWANPTPLPTFASVPPATRPANALAPEGQRQQPPAPGTAVPVTPPVIAESKLANGMTLVAARTGNVPLATMTMVFRAAPRPIRAERRGWRRSPPISRRAERRPARPSRSRPSSNPSAHRSAAAPGRTGSRSRSRLPPPTWRRPDACSPTSFRMRTSRPTRSSASGPARSTRSVLRCAIRARLPRWWCSRSPMAARLTGRSRAAR